MTASVTRSIQLATLPWCGWSGDRVRNSVCRSCGARDLGSLALAANAGSSLALRSTHYGPGVKLAPDTGEFFGMSALMSSIVRIEWYSPAVSLLFTRDAMVIIGADNSPKGHIFRKTTSCLATSTLLGRHCGLRRPFHRWSCPSCCQPAAIRFPDRERIPMPRRPNRFRQRLLPILSMLRDSDPTSSSLSPTNKSRVL